MKKYLKNLVALLCVLSLILVSINYQSVYANAATEDMDTLASATDATDIVTTETTEEILEDNTTEELTTEVNSTEEVSEEDSTENVPEENMEEVSEEDTEETAEGTSEKNAEEPFKPSFTTTDMASTSSIGTLVVNEGNVNTGTIYEINTQDDWNNLFTAVTDNTNWAYSGSTTYIGTDPAVINVNVPITGTTNNIRIANGASITINFNNNSWNASTFTMALGSLTINGAVINNVSFNITACPSVEFNDTSIDMASATNSFINYNSNGIAASFNDCTISNNSVPLIGGVAIEANNATSFNNTNFSNINASVAVLSNSSTINIESCNFTAGATACNLIESRSLQGNCSINNSTFTGFNTVFGNSTTVSTSGSLTGSLNITNCKFYDNFNVIKATCGRPGTIAVSGCEFSLNEIMSGSSAIHAQPSGDVSISTLSFSNNNFTNYDNAITVTYSSGLKSLLIDNCDITNCVQGIYTLYSNVNNTTIKDCEIIGRDYTLNNTCGMVLGSTRSVSFSGGGTKEDFIAAIPVHVENCDIQNVYTGMKPSMGSVYVYNTPISECNIGYKCDSGGRPFVESSTITASKNPTTTSIGIDCASYGGLFLNSTITEFDIGGNSTSGNSLVFVGCRLINNTIGAKLYCTAMYACEVIGSETGVYLTSDAHIVGCKIEGNGSGTGIDLNDNGASANSIYCSDKYQYGKRFTEVFNLAPYAELVNFYERNEISNFKYGMHSTRSCGIKVADTVIWDCEYGISIPYFFMMDNNEIYNCDYGIHCSDYGGLYFNSIDNYVTNKIYDCKLGLFSNIYATGSIIRDSNSAIVPNLDIYNCNTGAKLGGSVSGIRLNAHDNSEGVIITNGNSFNFSLHSYSNTIRNLTIHPEVGDFNCYCMSWSGTDANTELRNYGDACENAYIDSKGGFKVGYAQFVTGDAKYYLTKDSYVYYRTGTFVGNMIVDVPDYAEGRVVAKTQNYSTAKSLIDSYKVRAFKEGWVITYDESDDSNGEKNMWLTAGCEVSYDYATNGGTSMSTLVDKAGQPLEDGTSVPYLYGESIDLTPTATKDGYEFIGWNTDKDAKVGLTQLEAGITNIVLYAIYKKTNTLTFKTYDTEKDYSVPVEFYNKEQVTTITLGEYVVETPEEYKFAGYQFNDNCYEEGASVDITLDDSVIYCLYDLTGQLTYLDSDDSVIEVVTTTNTHRATEVANNSFKYQLKEISSKSSYSITGWIYGDEILKPNDIITTTEYAISVKADYEPIIAKSIEVLPETATIAPQESILLTAVILPEDTLNKSVTWRSENPAIAYVDEFGRVYGKVDGVVKIWATTTDGSNLSDYSTITVKTPEIREVTVTGTLTYPSGEVVANKVVTLKSSDALVDDIYTTSTNEKGYYKIEKVLVGNYEFIVSDGDTVLASCQITVAASDKTENDNIAVVSTNDNATVDHSVDGNIFVINVNVTKTTEAETPKEPEDTPKTTEDTPKTPEPSTGDNFNLIILIAILLLSGTGILILRKRKEV